MKYLCKEVCRHICHKLTLKPSTHIDEITSTHIDENHSSERKANTRLRLFVGSVFHRGTLAMS